MKQRQYSIEWLRVWAMFFITYGHLVGYASHFTTLSDASKSINQYLLSMGMGAVDCFILITGYFSIKQETCFVKILNIYFEVVFLGILSLFIAFVFLDVKPQVVLIGKVLLPLAPTKFNYWFITKYLGLVLLAPYINHLYDNLSRRSKLILVIEICFLNLSLLTSGLFPWGSQYGGGWTLMWFICLYIIGRTLKEYEEELRKIPRILFLAIWTVLYTLYVLNAKYGILSWADLGYNSIFTLMTSLCLFELAISFKDMPRLIIGVLSPSIMAVYIIHSNYFVRQLIEQKLYNWLNNHLGEVNVTSMILLTVVFFVLALLLDCIRRCIFELFGIDKAIRQFGKKISLLLCPAQ